MADSDYKNSIGARAELETGSGKAFYFRLAKLAEDGIADISRLPFSIKILLEAVLRTENGLSITQDDVMKLALHCGYGSNYYLKCEKGSSSVKKDGYIITTTEDHYNITIVTKQVEPLVNKYINEKDIQQDSIEKYTGTVHCCTVPGDGIIYVRRNGKTVWCGNSRHA